jgi:hypothetical protein
MAAARARMGFRGVWARRMLGLGSSTVAVSVLLGVWAFAAWGALPDGRRYERVSPQDKNGGDVLQMSRRVRAAKDGSAAGFASLVGFAGIPGMGYTADYMAVRGSAGWSTHGITPRQEPLSAQLITAGPGDRLYEGEFSDDFTKGVARVTEFPGVPANVAATQNLLVREDLLTPGLGTYQLASDSTVPITPREGNRVRPFYAGASTDFGHVIFQTHLNLTPETTGVLQKLYEFDHGTVRLVGVLPDGTISQTAVAGQSASGISPGYVERAISADGSRIYFTIQDTPGVRIGVGSATGQVYVRVDASSTVKLNVSEKREPDAPGSAEYWAASRDGRFAFFSTPEQLVEQDTNGGVDLYRFDLQAPEGARLRLLSIDEEPDDGTGANTTAVLGASESGEQVYFTVEGQLVDGAPIPVSSADQLIYLWDQGQLKYVGQVDRGELRHLIGDLLAPKTARVTPDGQHLLYLTGELEPTPQLYLYSAQASNGAGQLACASCPPDGSPATAPALIDVQASIAAANETNHKNHTLSDDGARVFFTSAQALIPEDHNSSQDAYQYTVASGKLDLISTGNPGAGPALFMDASASGNDVFFTTRERLVGWDRDAAVDLYDARVGGGFPEPVVKHPCQPQTCQAPPPPRPVFSTPPTSFIRSSGKHN